MRTIKRILVGVELTGAPEPALQVARRLARAFGAEVVLAHAITEPMTLDVRQDIMRLLGAMRTELEADGLGVYTPSCVREGAPADVVLAAVDPARADLIVLGAGQKTLADRLLLGSTAERVTRESVVPVWLTRPGDGERPVKRIVCALDGSDVAAEALTASTALARTFGAHLDVLTVTRPWASTLGLHGPAAEPGSTSKGGALDRALAAADLEGIQHRLLLRPGEPATGIVECAAEVGADLLVIGTAGRRGLARLVRGNTAEKVLRAVPCSTLVVPRQDAPGDAGPTP